MMLVFAPLRLEPAAKGLCWCCTGGNGWSARIRKVASADPCTTEKEGGLLQTPAVVNLQECHSLAIKAQLP